MAYSFNKKDPKATGKAVFPPAKNEGLLALVVYFVDELFPDLAVGAGDKSISSVHFSKSLSLARSRFLTNSGIVLKLTKDFR